MTPDTLTKLKEIREKSCQAGCLSGGCLTCPETQFLLDLIDKQARALEQSKTALEHALELDCFTPGGSTEMLAKDAITAIDEILK